MTITTKTQINYFFDRLEEIKKQKVKEINQKYKDKVKELSTAEKLEALRNKNFVVKDAKESGFGFYNDINKYVAFNDEIPFDNVGRDKEVEDLNKQVMLIKDTIIFGDSSDILKAIKELSEYKI